MSGLDAVLLDTHAWIWLATDSDRVSDRLRATLSESDRTLLLSAASCWEMAIKYRAGKLAMPDEPARYVPDRCELLGVESVPIQPAHALRVAALPDLHRDPFDRLIVAQAQILGIPIVTAEPRIRQYDVATIDARTGATSRTRAAGS